MPDLTPVYVQVCRSLQPHVVSVGRYHVEVSADRLRCNCPAYRFSDASAKTCKHVKGIKLCGWDAQWGEPQTEQQKQDMVCPKCGGETAVIKVMV